MLYLVNRGCVLESLTSVQALDLWVHLGTPALAQVDGVSEVEQVSVTIFLTMLTHL